MTDYEIEVKLTDEDRGYVFAEFRQPVDVDLWFKGGEDPTDLGDIYRAAQRTYGRCTSSIYVDCKDDEGRWTTKKVGWFFLSRQRYEDTGEPYRRGAWVTLLEVVPEVVSYADMGESEGYRS